MRKLITALAAIAAILIAGSFAWKAEAAAVTGVGSLPPLTKTYSPVDVRCVCGPFRCVCGHPYYPYYRRYGSGYPPYRPYGYYGYGYRPYGYGYRWRY